MNQNPARIAKTRQLLTEALEGVEGALKSWAQSPLPFSTEKELSFLAAKLREMLESLELHQTVQVPGLWRIVTDTWPYTNKLRQKIVEAELEYERLK